MTGADANTDINADTDANTDINMDIDIDANTVSDAFAGTTIAVEPELAHAIIHPAARPAEEARRRDFATLLRGYADQHLRGGRGWFVLSGLDDLDEPRARRFALAASAALGPLLPQDSTDALIREVRDRGVRLEDTATARYSDTRQGGNLHSDGFHRPGPVPAYFTLYCVRPASVGGDTILVRVADLVRILARDPDVLAALTLPVHVDTRGGTPGGPHTVTRPILDLSGPTPRMSYLRPYIDSAHRHKGVPPLREEQIRAMDALDALLDRTDLQLRGRLGRGQMAFINNGSLVHGRTPFAASPGPHPGRLLLRTWIGSNRHSG